MVKGLVQRMLHRLGWHLAPYPFHAPYYLRHTARRLEHLACLALPVEGKSVLEVGAGVGDFSHFYLDRGCSLTMTDARPGNVRYLENRYPGRDVRLLDLEAPDPVAGGPWEVVHCYGMLYHTGHPAEVLDRLASVCSGFLVLETKVTAGAGAGLGCVPEDRRVPSLAVHGIGCRPGREWVYQRLSERFEHVYVPRTQPRQEEFLLDWGRSAPGGIVGRAVFVGSRYPLESSELVEELLERQVPLP